MARRIGFGDSSGSNSAVRRRGHRTTEVIWPFIAVLVLLIVAISLQQARLDGMEATLSNAAGSLKTMLGDGFDPKLLGFIIPVGVFALILFNAALKGEKQRKSNSSAGLRHQGAATSSALGTPSKRLNVPPSQARKTGSPWERTARWRPSETMTTKAQPAREATSAPVMTAKLPLGVRLAALAILAPMIIGFGFSAIGGFFSALQALRFGGVGAALGPGVLALFMALVARGLFALFWVMLMGPSSSQQVTSQGRG